METTIGQTIIQGVVTGFGERDNNGYVRKVLQIQTGGDYPKFCDIELRKDCDSTFTIGNEIKVKMWVNGSKNLGNNGQAWTNLSFIEAEVLGDVQTPDTPAPVDPLGDDCDDLPF